MRWHQRIIERHSHQPVACETETPHTDLTEEYRQLKTLVNAIDSPIALSDMGGAEARCKDLEAFLVAISTNSAHPDIRKFLAAGYFDLGSAYRRMQRVAEAEKFYAEAIVLLKSLTELRKYKHFADSQLAACKNHLGLLYMDCGPMEKAVASLEEAIALRRGVASQDPDDLENLVYLAGAICNRAHMARDGGDTKAALPLYDEAITTLTEVIPKCGCEREQAMAAALASAAGRPALFMIAHHFRANALDGRRALTSMNANEANS